jgi:uncharacterized membrane protein (UPF0127 family)
MTGNKVLRGNTLIEGNFKLNWSRQPPDLQMSSGCLALAKDESEMQRQKYCVYNQTRESFLSLGVAAADTTMARLKGLIGKLTLGLDEGLWIVPSRGIHTVGVLFPLDLVYLDESYKVLHVVESFPTFRISPLIAQAASVLELPTHTIYSSQTQPGDQLVICVAEEMEQHLSTSAPNLTSRAQ